MNSSFEKPFNIYFLVTFVVALCHGFNVDMPSRIVHTSPQPGSWFGYSVAMYKHGNINTLLVGAPKFNTTQPGVVEGGAVLRCSVESSRRSCEYVPFDNTSHMRLSHMDYHIDSKNYQFFGATLKSRDGIVVACAPRYVWYTSSRTRREPVGTCYVAREDLTDFQEFSPCRTDKWGYHRQGSCQAGFDAALTTGGDRMYIGAPGAYYWQGQGYGTRLGGQIHSQSLFTRNEYFTTGEGPADEDDQYLGYSVAAGDFTGDGLQDIALGVPKGLNYTGKVSLYSHDLQWLQNITGDQLGSYFGYCLAVIDFNGDALDDIVVGAPMFTDYEDREMKIEVGKVHVLLQNSVHRFRRQIAYFGTVSRGRFGLSVASIGDINLDNYGDFAVGAPYGGKDGRGAVFIYHGFAANEGEKMKALMTKPAQVIYATDVARSFSTFGWSLAGGLDVDGNEYPDILVGAYEAEHVILFKSRPIIKFLEHKLEFESEGKTIDAKTKNCQIQRDVYHSCVNLVFCLKYTGVNVDDDIELEVEFRLDTKQSSEQRMLFEDNNNNVYRENIRYTRETIRCRNMKTYLKSEIVDKLTPISANVSYTLKELRRSPRSLTPVLDQDQRLSMQDSLTIQKNCGPDNICIPNLSLTFDAPDEFIIGQKDMLNVSIGVINEGEDAFEATVLISEPKGLLFNKFEPRENTSCSTRNIGGNTFIKCDIGNPLPKDQKVNFHVFFQQSGELEKPEFEFLVTANSTNAEANTYADNEARKVVEAKVEAKLTLFGSSDPDSIIYNTSLYQIPVRHHESHYGPSVVHKYGLLSEGPSDIEHAEIVILWPSRTLSEKHLLYLMEQPVTVGKIKCDPLPYINPLNLNTISQEERRSILGLTSLEGTYQASTEKETSSRFHQSSSISSNTGKISSGSKSSISSSSSSSSSSSISSSTSEGRKSSTPTQRGGSSYYYSQRSGSAGGRHGSSSGQVSSSGSAHASGTSTGGFGSYSSGQEGYKEENRFTSSSSTDDRGGIGYSYSSSGEERSRTAAHYPSSSFQGGSRGGGYSTSTSVHENQRGNDQYSSSSSPSSFDGTYREGSYFSSGHRGSESGYSASAAGSQRGPILPSSGRDGKFTSTLFNVHGGESTGGERTSSSSASESGFSSQSEADRRYGSASSGHYSGGRGSDASTSQSHGGGYSGHRGSESTGGERTSSSSASESGFSSQSEADRRYGSASSGHYSGGRGSDASTSQSHGGGYSSSTSYSSPEEKSRSGHASVRKEHHYYSSSDGLGSEHRSHSGSKDDGRQYSSSYYVEHSPDVSSSSSFSHRSSSKSSSSSSLPDQYYRQNEIDSRRKRETATEDEWDNLVRECGATLCTRIHCRTERLTANDDVYIYIRSRLWVDTLNEFKFPVDDVTVSTRMVARVHVEPHEIASESSNIYTKNVITPIRSAKSLAEAPPVPWWVILLATLAGILILLLIILILWKCGYFKRHRPRHKARVNEESHSLNPSPSNGATNGINGQHRNRLLQPGDEAL
ncbi:UNVERIFIED_CONTAM: hypothetical protein RMT77_010749 [Armadillidium vulgare]